MCHLPASLVPQQFQVQLGRNKRVTNIFSHYLAIMCHFVRYVAYVVVKFSNTNPTGSSTPRSICRDCGPTLAVLNGHRGWSRPMGRTFEKGISSSKLTRLAAAVEGHVESTLLNGSATKVGVTSDKHWLIEVYSSLIDMLECSLIIYH